MRNLPDFNDYDNQPIEYVQLKCNGHLAKIYVDKCGNIRVLSKNDIDITEKVLSVTHIKKELNNLPPSTQCFAELHEPGGFSSDVPTYLNDGDERLQLSIFACPTLDGRDLFDEPLELVEQAVVKLGLEFVPVFKRQFGPVNQKDKQRLLDEAEESQIEGWVLKAGHMTGWYKLKPIKTADAFVHGVTVSDSDTYRGCLKAVKLAVWDGQKPHDLGACGGGFSKEFKLSMNTEEKRAGLMNRVCEVEYNDLTSGDKLKWPRFIRWRDDKDRDQCKIEQIKQSA